MRQMLYLFGLIAFFLHCQSALKEPQTPTRPNIVWLVAEDLSPYLPSFGDSTVKTPNLSRLAAEGVRYNRFFSVNGVCAPSRAAICTGMYPASIGANHMRVQWNKQYLEGLGLKLYECVPPPEVKMMSQILRENGYYCANNSKTDYQFVPTETAWDESSNFAHWRNRGEGQPFFAVFNFDVTHESQIFGPYHRSVLRYNGNFPGDPATDGPKYQGDVDSADWYWNVPEDMPVKVPPYLVDDSLTRVDIRRNYSNIIEMDKQVGVILDQLESDGLLDQTIVVWYSDHGGPLPREKRLLYDSGIRVPMIIRYPDRHGAGTIDSQLISFVDLAPTAFSWAGVQPPAWIQGQAFDGSYQAAPRKYIYAASDRFDSEYDRIRAVRDDRYKYLLNLMPEKGYYLPVAYRENMNSMKSLLHGRDAVTLNEWQAQWFRTSKPREELFDTRLDPYEFHNLATDTAYAGKLAEMRSAWNNWQVAYGDLGLLPEGELLERFWPGRIQPVTATPELVLTDEGWTITCTTAGAQVGYRKKDTTGPWMPYLHPLDAQNGPWEVIAHRIGFKPSPVVTSSH